MDLKRTKAQLAQSKVELLDERLLTKDLTEARDLWEALAVERGLATAAKDVVQMFMSGGPLYFIFHIQTRAHYFQQTLLAGGAACTGGRSGRLSHAR